MDNSAAVIETSICALLRGEPFDRVSADGTALGAGFRDRAAYHGVGPLVTRRLSLAQPCDGLLTELEGLARELKDEVATELARKHELVRVLSALHESGVTTLLLKGTALAYSVYPSPALRPRADTDLLIRHVDREKADRTLSSLGYEKPNAISGELVKYQCGYVRRDRFEIDHVLDVHWRINNTQMFSQALEYEELRSRAVPLPALCSHATALAPADALLLACMHRVHHFHSPVRIDGVANADRERLIWLYDIHLLINAMSSRELAEFTRLAHSKGMRAICRDGLIQARRCFGTRLPGYVLQSLARGGSMEYSAAYLRKSNIRHLLTEFRALPRWRDRITLLGEHLFPPSDYMLEKYAVTCRAWLPWLYLQRGIHGAWKRILNP